MQPYFSGLITLLLITSCATSGHSDSSVQFKNKPIPFIPPGKEIGETWPEAKNYEYEMDIYVTPEYIAYPLIGTRHFLSILHEEFQDQGCKGGDTRIILRFVISPNGQLIGIHPIGSISRGCLSQISESIINIKFHPAEHNDENVYMLLSATVNDRR